ncbi:DUF397 domain-containing protein [Streptomyces noursei]|uniref:DUF397 domain-containing protein n=1 Tax=Streptomyces noursei TaxID=1971 RepID=UPI00344FF8D8
MSEKNMAGLGWFKSSFSGEQGACVEVADARARSSAVFIRDSKDQDGEVLSFGPEAFTAFVNDVCAGGYES